MSNKLTTVLISTLLMFAGSASAALCVPTEVAQIDSRIHIRCEQAVSDGGQSIWYFALRPLETEMNQRQRRDLWLSQSQQ